MNPTTIYISDNVLDQVDLNLFAQCISTYLTKDDACQIIYSRNIRGPIIGTWEGCLKLFPDGSIQNAKVWKDKERPDPEPIRGLACGSKGEIIFCTDFELVFFDHEDLSEKALAKNVERSSATLEMRSAPLNAPQNPHFGKILQRIDSREVDTCKQTIINRLSVEQPDTNLQERRRQNSLLVGLPTRLCDRQHRD